MTSPELCLWNALKRRPEGFKFRRQHDLDPYVLDFFCHEAALAIEVDGISHELGNNPERDERRDAWCADRGIHTLRIAAIDVRDNLEEVVLHIIEHCRRRSPDCKCRGGD